MADNVDDDPANLDGRDTIHYMGMTVAVSPSIQANHRLIPRNDVQNDQLKALSSNLSNNDLTRFEERAFNWSAFN